MSEAAFTSVLAVLMLIALCLSIAPVHAQDGLNLPAELYVLLNSGTVERYGIGAAGVQTVTPQDEFVLDFAIAPGAERMAYRTEAGLMLYDLAQFTGSIMVEGVAADVPPVRGRGDTIAWTADGDTLAYTTNDGIRVAFNINGQPAFASISVSPIYDLKWSPDGTFLAAEAEQNVWWIYRRFENQMILTSAIPFSRGAAWLDDSRLVFAPEAGLIVMDMANRNTQTTLLDLTRVYLLPYVQADDALVVFSRPASATELDDLAGSYQRFAVQGTDLTLVESSDNILDLTGVRWAPDGELLTLFTGGSLVLVLPQSGEGFPLPIVNAVMYGWGNPRPQAATGFSFAGFEGAGDGYFIAPGDNGVRQVWRLPGNGLPPTVLTAAITDVTDYAVSDANLAYVSDNRIWLQPFSDGQVSELAALASEPRDLAFNPAGDTLAYVTFATPEILDGGIWTLPLVGGEATLLLRTEPGGDLPMFDYRMPQFAPNFNALLAYRRTGELFERVIVDTVSGEVIELGAYLGGWWLADGRVLLYGTDVNEDSFESRLEVADVFSVPVSTTPLLRSVNTGIADAQEIAPGQIRALLVDETNTTYTLVNVLVERGEPDEIAQFDYFADPVIAPDGTWIAGLLEPEAALILYSLPQDETSILTSPEGISQFMWGAFR